MYFFDYHFVLILWDKPEVYYFVTSGQYFFYAYYSQPTQLSRTETSWKIRISQIETDNIMI